MILKWFLKNGIARSRLTCLWTETLGGYCDRGNEPSISVKWKIKYRILKKDPALLPS